MAVNRYQHIDLRVRDMDAARAFYSKLLPEVGFPTEERGKLFTVYIGEGEAPYKPWFGFTCDPDHRPNANRISFSAATRDEVDRIAEVATRAGARNMSGPRECPEYSPTYYAAFFEDPFGNCLEVCHYGPGDP